jgi:hypothetical protein
LCASHAFLGQLDVNPCGPPGGGTGELRQAEFWVQRAGTPASGTVRLRLEGRSEASGRQDGSGPDGRSDGRVWQHHVKLTWDGFIDMQGNRVTRLLLAARGSEQFRWGNAAFKGGIDVARLPAGRPIDFAGEVRYGIIGEPVAGKEGGAPGPPAPPSPGDIAAIQARFQRKMQQVQAGVQRWQAQGRDPSPVAAIMQQFEPLMRAGRLREAEAVLDRALALVGETKYEPVCPPWQQPHRGVRH